jgi:hypothetical protein
MLRVFTLLCKYHKPPVSNSSNSYRIRHYSGFTQKHSFPRSNYIVCTSKPQILAFDFGSAPFFQKNQIMQWRPFFVCGGRGTRLYTRARAHVCGFQTNKQTNNYALSINKL